MLIIHPNSARDNDPNGPGAIVRVPHRRAPATGIVHTLYRDYETRSRVDLRKVGVQKYAADPATEVLCAAYTADDGPVQLWRPGDPVPPEFFEAAANPTWVVAAHNDAFEAAIEQHVLHARYGWPLIPLERHVCTQAMCLALGLPARLGAVADALELANRKDAAGERLMHQMSKPRRARKGEDRRCAYGLMTPIGGSGSTLMSSKMSKSSASSMTAASAIGCGTGAVGT